jgi:hypothetical protein
MARMLHGQTASLEQVKAALDGVRDINNRLGLASAPVRITEPTPFDYMFPQLQADADALLPTSDETVQHLIALGQAMNDKGDRPEFASSVPSAYTYFGQFVAHEITLELQSDEISHLDLPKLKPLSPDIIRDQIKNSRTPVIDLDSVYGATSDGTPVPRNGELLTVGTVVRTSAQTPDAGPRPPRKDAGNDLPRKPPSADPRTDREAQIGDARNDENLITAQMHLAFLRAHNALAERGLTYREARKALTQHFQWLIVNDYLPRIVGGEVVNEILIYGNRLYRPRRLRRAYVPLRPPLCSLSMPLEFSAAAFRFGHSMVRSTYDYNSNFRDATAAKLGQLFSLTAFNGELSTFRNLPEKWIIEWEHFLDGGSNEARKIGPRLVEPLSALQDTTGRIADGVRGSLAVRNLLRGYLLRLPTGQQVAKALGLPEEDILSGEKMKEVAAEVNPKQAEVLQEGGFLERTPLWYYILAEAAADSSDLLGPVGGTIVAEVLLGLVRWSEDSILSEPDWKPTAGSVPGKFELQDLFELAGVWA